MSGRRRRIAVIGTGIAGMTAAWLLKDTAELSVFEAGDYIGGHTHTLDVERDGERLAIDTGFIVFNRPNYPLFSRLLDHLGVASQPSEMSFSVRCDRTGLEYSGTNLNTLFAQRRNLLRPSFYGMIRDILRFNRESVELLDGDDTSLGLGEFLDSRRYGKSFVEHYILPMGAALWSATPGQIRQFPARTFVSFFKNHGFLEIDDRPQWLVVKEGSARYVEALTAPFRDRIRLSTPIERIRRLPAHVEVAPAGGRPERFDAVVIATHSDQALRMLADPSDDERQVLGAIRYQPNEVALHTDPRLMPRRRRAWASWNYRIPAEPSESVRITYCMNSLQGLRSRTPFLVSLNSAGEIDPSRIIATQTYDHPIFDAAAIAAQRGHARINGGRRTYYCGAYWGNGFHEDGVRSAHDAVGSIAEARAA
jgi:predicted NAD/FAD-binding protein